MNEFIRKTGSRVLGAIFGLITGVGAGFLPGFHTLLEGGGEYVGGILYLLSLPFCILWHMGRGTYEGAKNGLIAGLTYPKTINDEYLTLKHNIKLSDRLQRYSDAPRPPSILLTDEAEQKFQTLLKNPQIFPEKRESLEENFKAYQEYLKTTKCVLTGRSIKELENPLEIKVSDQSFVCELSAFQKLVDDCYEKQIPINFNKVNKPAAKDIIKQENVFIFNIKSIPQKIANFIDSAKKLFSSMHLINETLGLQNTSPLNVISTISEAQSNAKDDIREKAPLVAVNNDHQDPIIQTEQSLSGMRNCM